MQFGHLAKFPKSIAVLKFEYGVMKIGDVNLCLQCRHLTVMLSVFASGLGSPLMIFILGVPVLCLRTGNRNDVSNETPNV